MSKTIGILGGMGPLATADLFRKITCLTKASCDNDHIRVYIDSNARIPDRTAAILSGGTNPVPEMTSALRHLEACGADCIIMPCNTAHYFLPQLQAKTETPFLSMLAATAKTCAAKFPGKTAAILGTKGTLATGLYDRALEGEGVLCSTGSACSSHKKSKSHVLAAMGRTPQEIDGALRFSLCPMNTQEEMDQTAQAIGRCVNLLRAFRRR